MMITLVLRYIMQDFFCGLGNKRTYMDNKIDWFDFCNSDTCNCKSLLVWARKDNGWWTANFEVWCWYHCNDKWEYWTSWCTSTIQIYGAYYGHSEEFMGLIMAILKRNPTAWPHDLIWAKLNGSTWLCTRCNMSHVLWTSEPMLQHEPLCSIRTGAGVFEPKWQLLASD
jgi:hypothetical protein